MGQAVEAVLGQEFRDLVQGGSLHLVGHRRSVSLGLVGTFQGNRRWPAASRPGEFTERMMHYPTPDGDDLDVDELHPRAATPKAADAGGW